MFVEVFEQDILQHEFFHIERNEHETLDRSQIEGFGYPLAGWCAESGF